MSEISGLVPSRFLILIGHLVLTITIMWSRDNNVRSCLPLQYTDVEYGNKDTQLVVGLSLTAAFLIFELVTFIAGISMFAPLTSLISIVCHATACVLLFYFVFDEWDCDLYWWIFGFCSILPSIADCFQLISTLCLRKRFYS